MKKTLMTLLLCLTAVAAAAQNGNLLKAKAALDEGETAARAGQEGVYLAKLQAARTLLETALENPKTTKKAEVYNMLAETYAREMNGELMRAAQGLAFDTLKYCTSLDKCIEYYTTSNKLDFTPDQKGRVKPQCVKANPEKGIVSNHDRVMSMVSNYNYAAIFANQMGDLKSSMLYFEKYINLPDNEIFTPSERDSIRKANAEGYAQSAFNVTLLNYQMKDWQGVLRNVDRAMAAGNSQRAHDLYLVKLTAQGELKDSTAWLATLKEAVVKLESAALSQNLLYYYYQKNQTAEAEQMTADMVAKSPESKTAWYLKGCVELNLKRDYPTARESFKKALGLDAEYPEAHLNIATTYTNEVIALRDAGKFRFIGTGKSIAQKDKAAYEKELAYVKSFYQNALPHLEKVRTLMPEEPKRWAYGLETVYSNLEMKDKLSEIQALIKTLQ